MGPVVRPEDPIELASSLMEGHGVSHLVVEDDGGQLVGLVARTGRRGAGKRTGRVVRVQEAMHPHPPTIDVDAPLREAFRLLRAHRRLGALAVVGRGRCLGVLTPGELAAVQDDPRRVLDRDGRSRGRRDRGLRGTRVAEERESGA